MLMHGLQEQEEEMLQWFQELNRRNKNPKYKIETPTQCQEPGDCQRQGVSK